jgi:hypothetical protein
MKTDTPKMAKYCVSYRYQIPIFADNLNFVICLLILNNLNVNVLSLLILVMIYIMHLYI